MRWTIEEAMITSYSISGDASDAFAFDATEVALGGPDTAPDDGGFVVESDGDGPLMQMIQQIQQQQQQGSEREATTPGPDDFVAESDAFAYDKLAVDQDGADRSGTGGYADWTTNYGVSATVSGLNPLNASDLALWQENYGRTASDDGVHLLGTSDAFAQTDFFLV
jgi:hypothetical protein